MTKKMLTQIVLPADPATAMEAATKQYVDAGGGGGGATTLDGLSDTTVASPADGEVLTYETASTQWKNKAPTGLSGGTKVTDLTALTGGTAAAGDLLEVIDVSDTTMAATGTNKKMALSELGVYARGLVKADTTTAYAPVLTDVNQMVTLSNTGAITVTMPQDSAVAFPVGAEIDFLQINTGQVTFAQGTGATVNATPGLKMRARWSAATAKKIAANTWVILGDLAP